MKKYFILCLLLVGCFLFSANNTFANTEKEVISDGIGTSENAAQEQAFRNAIRSVVGSMVLSEVVVENDAILRDKVLSHSNGYITKSKQIGETRVLDGGLVEVTMQVTVKTQELTQKLKDEKISIIAVDGQSLFAQIKTKEEAKKNAVAILEEKFKNFPAVFLKAETNIDKSTTKPLDNGLTRLTVPVTVSIDKTDYATFYKDLTTTLDSLGFESKSISTPIPINFGEKHKSQDSKRPHRLIMCETYFERTHQARWKIYNISEEVYNYLSKEHANFNLLVQLYKNENELILESSLEWNWDTDSRKWGVFNWFRPAFYAHNYTDSPGIAIIAPVMNIDHSYYSNPSRFFSTGSLAVNFNFDLTDAELEDVSLIKFTISKAE